MWIYCWGGKFTTSLFPIAQKHSYRLCCFNFLPDFSFTQQLYTFFTFPAVLAVRQWPVVWAQLTARLTRVLHKAHGMLQWLQRGFQGLGTIFFLPFLLQQLLLHPSRCWANQNFRNYFPMAPELFPGLCTVMWTLNRIHRSEGKELTLNRS